MHCGEIEMLPLSLAWKLGLHPSTLVCINCSSSNLPKWPPPSLACLCSQIIPFIIMILYSWGSHDLHNLPWISYILLVKDVRAGIGFLEEGSTTRDICVDPTTILLCRNNTAPILKTEFLECRTKFLPYDYFYASFVLILCPSPDSHQDLNIFNFSQHNPQIISTIFQRSLQWDDDNSHGRFVLFVVKDKIPGTSVYWWGWSISFHNNKIIVCRAIDSSSSRPTTCMLQIHAASAGVSKWVSEW
jgi:hypothetical protein